MLLTFWMIPMTNSRPRTAAVAGIGVSRLMVGGTDPVGNGLEEGDT